MYSTLSANSNTELPYRADWIDNSNPNIIVFIDELHTLVGAGAAEGSIDASNMLKPALARGELRAIGATTLKEYQKHIEKDPALARRREVVGVQAAREGEAREGRGPEAAMQALDGYRTRRVVPLGQSVRARTAAEIRAARTGTDG